MAAVVMKWWHIEWHPTGGMSGELCICAVPVYSWYWGESIHSRGLRYCRCCCCAVPVRYHCLLPLCAICLQPNNVVAPRKRGVISSMAAASDGPRQPIPDTVWVTATTGALLQFILASCLPFALGPDCHSAHWPAKNALVLVYETGWAAGK